MAENLKNTIKVDTIDYNINAVHSDTAETAQKTQASLTLSKSLVDGIDNSAVFNGEIAQTLNYVPADGGAFTGPVHISNGYSDIDSVDRQAIINLGQIDDRVSLLTGMPCLAWDGNILTPSVTDSKYSNLGIITGTAANFTRLNTYISNMSITYSANLKTVGAEALTIEVDASGEFATVTNYTGSGHPIKVVIPDTYTYTDAAGEHTVPVTKIGDYAFDRNKGTSGSVIRNYIETIIIPDSITTIGRGAFRNCLELMHISIPSSVTSLGINAFGNCSALVSVEILADAGGNGLLRLDESTFKQCRNLETLILPKSLKYLHYNAFERCVKLKGIYYSGTESDWERINGITSTTTHDGKTDTADALKAITMQRPINTTNLEIKFWDNTSSSNDYTITTGLYFDFDVTAYEALLKKPFIYICVDAESATSPVSNKMFLSIPGDGISEIAKGATRLNSIDSANTQNYYTYEGLAEIIARINTRLDGLGLGVNATVLAPMYSVEDVNKLVPDVEITESFDPKAVPTIDDLNTSINNLRADLDDLAREVEVELNRVDNNININSRLTTVERAIENLSGKPDTLVANKLQLGDTIMTEGHLKKLINLLDSIDWTEA